MAQLPEFDYVDDLGGGHFGHVYLCRNKLSGEEFAVKHIDLPPAATAEDWRREAEALAACDNSHVVRIHHATVTADGPVLVMEYLPGGTAEKRWLPNGGAVGDVVRCLLDATWGLAHLHNEGLVHRDLRPANLLFDGNGNAVIGDFGLAGQATSTAPFDYLPHVPPEVAAGGPWTPQADLYALGVTGWRLLGAPPHPSTAAEITAARVEGTWPNPDVWPLHVHAALRKVLRAAMSADPSKRPASAQRLREQLLKAAPIISWAADSPTRWIGDDGSARYEVVVSERRNGFDVELTRDLGSGFRRVKNGCLALASEPDVLGEAARVLEALAARGVASLGR